MEKEIIYGGTRKFTRTEYWVIEVLKDGEEMEGVVMGKVERIKGENPKRRNITSISIKYLSRIKSLIRRS